MTLLIEYQYFGCINYYNALCKYKYIQFEVFENYQKSSFRNKMELASPQGRQVLSVPILGGRGIRQPMYNVGIDNRQAWQTNNYKTIVNLYNRSPWFEYYKDSLYELYQTPVALLTQWNKLCTQWALAKLKVNAILTETANYTKTNHLPDIVDYRNNDYANHETGPIHYLQVFDQQFGFMPNLSILDLLFCEGPNAVNYFGK